MPSPAWKARVAGSRDRHTGHQYCIIPFRDQDGQMGVMQRSPIVYRHTHTHTDSQSVSQVPPLLGLSPQNCRCRGEWWWLLAPSSRQLRSPTYLPPVCLSVCLPEVVALFIHALTPSAHEKMKNNGR
mmetsp:Transcript_5610/g.13376  ORF Transcript_5610/g.13376 Transcript_5610/m.13376 type:complete len:127 (-) Transcript_5610:113-493(-)